MAQWLSVQTTHGQQAMINFEHVFRIDRAPRPNERRTRLILASGAEFIIDEEYDAISRRLAAEVVP